MDIAELQKLVETISQGFFWKPFMHQVKINYRMTTAGGRYHLDDHHIEINAHFLAEQYREALIAIIKHELCHYHLHLAKKGYRHRDRDFKILLKKVGGSRYVPDIGLRRKQKTNYLYICTKCRAQYFRIRRINTQKYCCGKCRGKLFLKENLK